MKVNRTHVHIAYEKIQALHCFRFDAERLYQFHLCCR